jgi:retron-type reverse transcriptase
MRRSNVGLADVADLHNLGAAFHAAAGGKRGRADVELFRDNLDHELTTLRAEILGGTVHVGDARSFRIRDPKPRIIHAPAFRERVLHHAIMAHAGPVLDRSLIFDTYACRLGKGSLAAVNRVRHHAMRHDWYTQIDIAGYFANIDQELLLTMLARKFRDPGLLSLFASIVRVHRDFPARGLPIGALTSQHFANFYLAPADRLLPENPAVRGVVRYMDDLIWWTDDRASARETLFMMRSYLRNTLRLLVKEPARVGRSRHGLMFCGFRVFGGRVLLSRRRKRRYRQARTAAENAYEDGRIDTLTMQAAYASALSLTSHADAVAWRRAELARHPVAVALSDL